jgi:helix-turn-helix protein
MKLSHLVVQEGKQRLRHPRLCGARAASLDATQDPARRLTADIIELARQYGRYGYRKVAALLCQAGWTINDKRVERLSGNVRG